MPLAQKNSKSMDKIVLAAGRLFSRQGYHGTTTREIARFAEVSENTLFRHFNNKEDLFWSVLRSYSSGLQVRRDLLEGIARCDPPEVILPKIIELFADTVNFRPELLRLVAVAFLELHPKADRFCVEHFSPLISTINGYLEMSIGSGRIRKLDSTMLTSALITTALMHAEIYNLIGGNRPMYANSLEAHRASARFWLDILNPRIPVYPSPAAFIGEDHIG
jgi:AcrR family transcriptional regulator